jgi:pSer/pThr/pTyr-binding forkhead associated (FHA) protein
VPLNRTLVTAPAGLSVQSVVGLIGRVFPLVKGKYSSPGPISVGRTPDNDVTIAESSISARHCFLRVLGSEIALSDAGSTNGTLVNGVKVPPRKTQNVVEGDVITLGRFTLGFHTPRGFIKSLRDRK